MSSYHEKEVKWYQNSSLKEREEIIQEFRERYVERIDRANVVVIKNEDELKLHRKLDKMFRFMRRGF